MFQEEDITDAFHVLDVIKLKLNEILIKGIESVGNENHSEIVDLTRKIEELNFSTLSKLLGSFLEDLEKLRQKPVPNDVRKKLSIHVMKIVTMTRMFERIMTLKSVKNSLE